MFCCSVHAFELNCPLVFSGKLNYACKNLSFLFLINLQNAEEDCGRIGLLMIVLGMFGSVIFGYILDKTHRFK